MITSSGPVRISVRAVSSALRRRFPWVSWAPFGVPVVPEVYRMIASSLPGSAQSASGSSVRSAAASASVTGITRAPASAAPFAASAAAGSHANISRAPESLR
jgi:hypothetical protein